MPNTHVAYVRRDVMNKLLLGKKTTEVRLSKRPHPARACEVGDTLLFRDSILRKVVAGARIGYVHSYSGLTPLLVARLWGTFGVDTPESNNFWRSKLDSQYGVVLQLNRVRAIEFPEELLPSCNRMAWVQNVEHYFLAAPAFCDLVRG